MLSVIYAVVFVLAVMGIWIILYDSHRFVTVTYTFSSARIKKKTRLVMMSDLHNYQYGKDNHQLRTAIEKASPDAIVIAGDMITAKTSDKFDKTLDFLKDLKEKYQVYYAYGNHEQKLSLYQKRYGDMGERFEKGLADTGIVPLRNARVNLPERGISVYGLEIGHDFFQRFTKKPMPEDYIEGLIGKKDDKFFSVLLAHNPEYFPEYAHWGADLVLSGHIHGGIVRVPFLGGLISPAIRFFPKYDGGLFREGEAQMVLGRGIGTHSPRVRMFNPAELVIIDLNPACITEEKQVK